MLSSKYVPASLSRCANTACACKKLICFYSGSHRKRQDTVLPDPHCAENSVPRRTDQETPCRSNHCLADKRTRRPNPQRSPIIARIPRAVCGITTTSENRREAAHDFIPRCGAAVARWWNDKHGPRSQFLHAPQSERVDIFSGTTCRTAVLAARSLSPVYV